MLKLILPLVLSATFMYAEEASARKTWYPNPDVDFGSASSKGNAGLSDMSSWMNDGVAGSGVPTANDDLIFDKTETGSKPKRLRFGGQRSFTGNSLQIGTDADSSTVVHDSETITFPEDSDGLKLKRGNWFCNGNGTLAIGGPVTVLAEDPEEPFIMHCGQEQYSNTVMTVYGPLYGSAAANFWLGPKAGTYGDTAPKCAQNTRYVFKDISGYSGMITVTSRFENVGSDFGTRLNLGPCDSQATIHIRHGGSLGGACLTNNLVKVKELSLAAGTRLYFDNQADAYTSNFWCVCASDALTVEGPVEICYRPIVRGKGLFRIPILVGPINSTFTKEDFRITFTHEPYNLDLHTEVEVDEAAGTRTLYLVTYGFVFQESHYDKEGGRDGKSGTPSSLTNAAAWREGMIPDPANTAVHYRTTRELRTLYAPDEPYVFPATIFRLQYGTLIIQTKTFEVPEFYCDGGVIGVGQSDYSRRNVSLKSPKIHFLGGDVHVSAYRADLFAIDGEIDGSGWLDIRGWGSTGSPTAYYRLTGLNTNYSGRITLVQSEVRPEYLGFDKGFATLYVEDGRNLGGRIAEFNPRAFTIGTYGRLHVTNNVSVTLAAGLNRGMYVKGNGCVHTENNATLDIRWPMLLGGKMWKEGPGTLVLGGAMKHELEDGGELTDVPRASSNLFEVLSGKVKIAHADALAGVETTLAAGTSLELVLDSSNADLTRYGIRNTSVDVPFVLDASFGGKLPLSIDASAVDAPAPGVASTNGILTVKSSSAENIGAMLNLGRIWRNRSCKVLKLVDVEQGITTFAIESRFVGTVLTIR